MSFLANDTGEAIDIVISTKDNPHYAFGDIPAGSGLSLEIEMSTFSARYAYAGKHCFLTSAELLRRSVVDDDHGGRTIRLKGC